MVVLTDSPEVFAPEPGGETGLPESSSLTGATKTDMLIDVGHGHRLQVFSCGSGPMVAAIPLGMEGFNRIESVLRLLAALHGRAIPPDTRLTAQQKARNHRMLQAFDGLRQGATQQEIAEVLFGIGRLGRDEWQASSARHRVMSYLRGAKAMVAGGYRRLLRHNRRD